MPDILRRMWQVRLSPGPCHCTMEQVTNAAKVAKSKTAMRARKRKQKEEESKVKQSSGKRSNQYTVYSAVNRKTTRLPSFRAVANPGLGAESLYFFHLAPRWFSPLAP